MTEERTSEAAASPSVLSGRRNDRWRHRYSSEERHRILRSVFLKKDDQWIARFAVMMACSVVISSLGLLSDSPAIVIGAMLIAPLITPIQAISVALAMSLGRRLLVPSVTIVAASVGSIALASLVSALFPADNAALPGELLARTSPDVRDLFVALAAGAAGAYATVREDVSTTLPGVAVAVALVPPLSAVGVALELGRSDLAGGAFLLYATNLVAIAGAGIVVMLITGFVPIPRIERLRPRMAATLAVVALAVAVLSIPLTRSLMAAVDAARTQQRLTELVASWLGPKTTLELVGIAVMGNDVTVDLSGPENPPPVRGLVDQMGEVLGEEVQVQVRWALRSATTQALGSASKDSFDPTEVRPIVQRWLDEDATGEPVRLVGLSVQGTVLTVEVAGPDEPPAPHTLRTRLARSVGAPERIDVRWTQQRTYSAAAGSELGSERATVRAIAEGWIRDGRIVESDLSGSRAVITLASESPPNGLERLEAQLSASLGRPVTVELRWVAEQVVTVEGEKRKRLLSEARSHTASWIAASRGTKVAGLDADVEDGSATLVVTLLGRRAPPPVEPLADTLAAAIALPLDLEVRWKNAARTVHAKVFALPPDAPRAEPSVLFGPGSATLTSKAKSGLRKVAERLRKEHADARIIVAGHTDDVGGRSANLRLSRRRAEAVRDWLTAHGRIDPALIAVRAYGESKPSRSEPRAELRRVDVIVGPRPTR